MTTYVNVGEVDSIANQISRSIESLDFTEPLTEISEELFAIHAQYFAREAGPSGQSWPPWYYRALGTPNDHRTLDVSGRLRESVTQSSPDHIQQVEAKRLTWGTAVPYAYKHQFGGVFEVDQPLIGRDGRGRRMPGDDINIPQREFVGMTSQNLDGFCQMLADFVVRQLRSE